MGDGHPKERASRRAFAKRGRGPGRPAASGDRVLEDLSLLEKALSQMDLAKQRESLQSVLQNLKPLRLRSIEDLDFKTKGRLITTLLRVGRQSKPPQPSPPSTPEGTPQTENAPSLESAPATVDAVQPPAAEASAPEPAAAEKAQSDTTPSAAEDPGQQKWIAYGDVMSLVGRVWREVGDERRAALAFEASGRPEGQQQAVEALRQSGDWAEEAQALERQQRFLDAARLYQRHQSYEKAAQLFEVAGNLKSAFTCALRAGDAAKVRGLLKRLEPDQAQQLLQKAGAYDLMMEYFVEAGDFDNVAKLYERSKQFDQAALAWERAGKINLARKAYERANDAANADRVRQLEVEALLKRGDRLGAALLLLGAGKREDAAQTLMALPKAKAFRFLQKARLDEEAVALARKEIRRAEAENNASDQARWLEWLGDLGAAAEAWGNAGRKDKALALFEQAGEWHRAAEQAEALGRKDKAIEFYHRAGDKGSAERVANQPPSEATQPTGPESRPSG